MSQAGAKNQPVNAQVDERMQELGLESSTLYKDGKQRRQEQQEEQARREWVAHHRSLVAIHGEIATELMAKARSLAGEGDVEIVREGDG
jgi:hypothetical protein